MGGIKKGIESRIGFKELRGELEGRGKIKYGRGGEYIAEEKEIVCYRQLAKNAGAIRRRKRRKRGDFDR